MPETKRLFLIDGSHALFRAFHAIRELRNSKGFPTNAIYGFTNMLVKIVKDHKPDYLVVCFDLPGPTFRDEMYEEYKATRPPTPVHTRTSICPGLNRPPTPVHPRTSICPVANRCRGPVQG